jgi:hypothetical protein
MPVSHRLAFVFLLASGCVVLSACSSIKSRIYDVDGVTSDERQVKRLRGIPTTMDVPTHVRITIEETKFFANSVADEKKKSAQSTKKDNLKSKLNDANTVIKTETDTITTAQKAICDLNADTVANPANKDTNEASKKTRLDEIKAATGKLTKANEEKMQIEEELKYVNLLLAEVTEKLNAKPPLLPINATRVMKYDLITKKELYTVDFKRPLSGSNDLKLEFGEASGGQFLKSAGQTTLDTTITDIGDLVEKTATALPKLLAISTKAEEEAKANAVKNAENGLFGISGVVAVQCFDIRDPMLDENIQAFLEKYINNCHPGCPPHGATNSVVPASHKAPARRHTPE